MTDLANLSIEELYALRNHQQSLASGYPTPRARRSPQLADMPIEQLIKMREEANPAYWGNNLQVGPVDTGIPLPVKADQFLSGGGQGATDLYRGGKQIVGQMTPAEVDAARKLDKPLMNTGPGAVGSFAGKAIPAAATMVVPGANGFMGSMLTGAALGGLEPVGTGESRSANVAGGTLGGGLGYGVSKVLGGVVAPVKTALNPEQQRLAQILMDNGVNLDLAQITGSKPLKIINSVLDNLPITSSISASRAAAQNQAFTKAAMSKAGENSSVATPEAVDKMFTRLGGNFANVYGRNSVKVDNPLMNDMVDALSKSDNAGPIVSKTDKIMNLGPDIPGQKYQDVRTQLRTLQGSTDPEVRNAARDLKYALDGAARRSVSPDDAALLDKTRQEYGNAKSIAQAQKASNAVGGNVPPAQLRMAVANGDPRGYVTGKGDLNDLSRAGTEILRDTTPNSGTAQRLFYQGLLTGGMGGGTYLGTGDLEKSLSVAGMGLLGPLGIQKMLSNSGLLPGLLAKYVAAGPTRGHLSQELEKRLAPLLIGAGSQYRFE